MERANDLMNDWSDDGTRDAAFVLFATAGVVLAFLAVMLFVVLFAL